MFVRIDRQTKIVLDKQEFGADGAMVAETRLQQVRYAAVPAANFALPKGYTVVQPQRLDRRRIPIVSSATRASRHENPRCLMDSRRSTATSSSCMAPEPSSFSIRTEYGRYRSSKAPPP